MNTPYVITIDTAALTRQQVFVICVVSVGCLAILLGHPGKAFFSALGAALTLYAVNI